MIERPNEESAAGSAWLGNAGGGVWAHPLTQRAQNSKKGVAHV
jgi:hypothetical protein